MLGCKERSGTSKTKESQAGLVRVPLFLKSHCIICVPSVPRDRVVQRANRPRSTYQYSNMAPRLSGQNCKLFKFLLSLNSQKRLEYKENNTKYRSLTRKPRSHVRILIYRTWPIDIKPKMGQLTLEKNDISEKFRRFLKKFRNFMRISRKKFRTFFAIFVSRPTIALSFFL